MILTLIRHGRTDWNEEGRMQGRRDTELSPAGRADVARWRLPPDLAGPRAWISSPLRRALDSASIASGRAPDIEPDLIEMDWGEWEGCRLDELRSRFGAAFAHQESLGLDFRAPGGESPREVLLRVRIWLARVAQWDQPVVAVTHNGVLRAALAAATGWDMLTKPPVRLRRDALHRFRVDAGGRIAVLACNVPLAPPSADGAP